MFYSPYYCYEESYGMATQLRSESPSGDITLLLSSGRTQKQQKCFHTIVTQRNAVNDFTKVLEGVGSATNHL